MKYPCPHCDEGPFEPDDWWIHFESHNTPWLQSRKPEDLERTDLGYGENLNNVTTIPTHDMPNENPKLRLSSVKQLDNEDVWELHPEARIYADIHAGSHPFVYDKESNKLLFGKDGEYHYSLPWGELGNPNPDEDQIWGRYFPRFNAAHVFGAESEDPLDVKEALNILNKHVSDRKLGAIPQAHRLVWLSQPNNHSLKYWHHNPSNTTYAWDFWGKNDEEPRHHWDIAKHLGIYDNSQTSADPNYYFCSSSWEGGFFTQNSGKHPTDIWGLPSQIDYAPIQGDGDYGNSVF